MCLKDTYRGCKSTLTLKNGENENKDGKEMGWEHTDGYW